MSAVTAGLLAQPALAIVAIVVAMVTRGRLRNTAAGLACAALGAVGAVTGALALGGGHGALRVPLALPLPPLQLAPTPLGGVFMLVAGAVGVLASLYAIGYVHGPTASRTQWIALAVFLLGMQLVPAAADVVGFLAAWELMAAASTVLVLAEHAQRSAAREAGLWYAVLTHLSMVAITAGFAVLATAGGGTAVPAVPRAWASCCSSSASPPRPGSSRCTCGCPAPTRRRRATHRP